MLKLFVIPGLIMLSCGSVKSNQSAVNADSVIVTASSPKKITDSLNQVAKQTGELPTCIKNKLDSFKVKEMYERPQKMVQYSYRGKKVYYVEMPCCDFFNEVYDDKCNYLGSPDGGFTGKGDGKLPDFFKEATNEKLIWKATK